MVDFLPGLLYGIGRKSDKKTGVGEIFWEDGSGEKRNRCESCANSSLYLGSGGHVLPLGNREGGKDNDL